MAASLYSSGRALVPEALTGLTGSLEATVTNISAPVLTAVQDGSGKVPRPPYLALQFALLCSSMQRCAAAAVSRPPVCTHTLQQRYACA